MMKFILDSMIMYTVIVLCMVTMAGGKEGEYLLVTHEVDMAVSMEGQFAGTITVALFGEEAPRTVANFVALANHTYGYGYRGSKFHSIVYQKYILGGDFEYGNGSGGYSIYGKYFDDEASDVEYDDGAGWVTTYNQNTSNTNSAVFMLTLFQRVYENELGLNLDVPNVGFGRITLGWDVVYDMLYPKIKRDVIITDCDVKVLRVYERYWIENQPELEMLPLDMVKSGVKGAGVVGLRLMMIGVGVIHLN